MFLIGFPQIKSVLCIWNGHFSNFCILSKNIHSATLEIREKSWRQKIAIAMPKFDSKSDRNFLDVFPTNLSPDTWNQSTDIYMIFISTQLQAHISRTIIINHSFSGEGWANRWLGCASDKCRTCFEICLDY